jgi:hypothetical protein
MLMVGVSVTAVKRVPNFPDDKDKPSVTPKI